MGNISKELKAATDQLIWKQNTHQDERFNALKIKHFPPKCHESVMVAHDDNNNLDISCSFSSDVVAALQPGTSELLLPVPPQRVTEFSVVEPLASCHISRACMKSSEWFELQSVIGSSKTCCSATYMWIYLWRSWAVASELVWKRAKTQLSICHCFFLSSTSRQPFHSLCNPCPHSRHLTPTSCK